MAKSVRSSVKKRNHANLRSKVFGPMADARTERLSAKLQELAAQPLKLQGAAKDTTEDTTKAETEAGAEDESDKMAIDESATSQSKPSTKRRSDRVRKQIKRKPRNSMVFPKPKHHQKSQKN